jgi:hypothetical protein
MPHAARFTRRYVVLRVLLVAVLAAGSAPLAIVSGQAAQSQTPVLTERLEIAPDGVTVRYPAGWSVTQEAHVARIVNLTPDRFKTADFQTHSNATEVLITVQPMPNHAEALRKTRDARAESAAPTTFLMIGGWPAVQRREVVTRQQPGSPEGEEEQRENEPKNDANGEQQTATTSRAPEQRQRLLPLTMLRITTAIAAGDLFVTANAQLLPNAPAAEEELVRAILRSVTFRTAGDPARATRELNELRAVRPRKPVPPPRSNVGTITPANVGEALRLARRSPSSAAGGRSAPIFAAAGLPQGVSGGSEAEIAVSTNGQNIIIGQAFNWTRSTDGGLNWANGAGFTGTQGDGSVTFGRSGAFYAATIGLNAASTAGTTRIYATTDNGATFPFRANAYTCPAMTDPFPCRYALSAPGSQPYPDQEHIAADRFNASAGGGDRVYSVWRNGPTATINRYGIVCSNDGGTTWGPRTIRNGDLPRVTVGQDGRVYVVYQSGDDIRLDRWAACPATAVPMTLEADARLVATLGPNNWVSCANGVPGLDRCNDGNNLSSFMVAVDDTDANHVFVTYAQNTGPTSPNNENIIVRDSTDSSTNWLAARVVTVSNASVARRFMPWVCSAGGVAYVNWFDRRAATTTNNSLTDFYAGSAVRNGAGNLVAGPERRVNSLNTADNQCEAGQVPGSALSWPSSTRSPNDSDTCTPQQPQLAGQCLVPGSSPPTGSRNPCDFSTPTCPTLPVPETCQPGSGVPKYGDYNGNACAAGRFYSIWPSATPAPALPAGPGIRLFFAAIVVAGSQIQIPGPVTLPDTCVGATSHAVANVCNTGKTDLHIDPITSSDAQFSVVTPSSGYPVTIGPSSCFPFDVRFTPTSPGAKSATLTVPSDDTVTPSATILVSGNGTSRSIVTAIADAGDFGTVAAGAFRDQPLVISNPGGCTLTVANITSSAPDFETASVVSYPIVIAPGTSVAIPIRFRPTSFGPKAANLTISNNDPLAPAKVVAVRGTGGVPVIVTSVVDTGSFGPVCVGSTRDLDITVTNSGTSALAISNITSSSPEFQVPQVLTFPIVVTPGTSVEVPIRFAPTTPGAKSATITIASNDPATPNKLVTMTADTPANELCHPPSFTSVGMSTGPTFGSSKTGDWTVTANGRHLSPFGEQHNFGVQAQGEYLYYSGRHEGQFDVGLLNRWQQVQLGVFSDFKFAEIGQLKNGGVLGQASVVLDLLFPSVRVNIFGSKGFKDTATLTTDTSFVFSGVPGPGTTVTAIEVEHVTRVVDTLGGGVLVGPWPNTEIDGHIMWLRRQRPTLLGDGVGVMARVTHHINSRIAIFGEFTLNETYFGPTNSGRVIGGFVFGRWTRPSDFTNKHTPLGTEVPRVHFDLDVRQK